jgi:transglutaminase-like putative cysteine protease
MLLTLGLAEGAIAWRLRAGAAVAGLVVVATSALSSVLAVPVGHLVLVTAAAASPALLAVGLLAPRAAAATMVLFAPVTLLAAGLPPAVLAPSGWPQLVVELGNVTRLTVAADGRWAAGPGSLAMVMLIAGALWTAGATLGAPGPGREHIPPRARARGSLGFALLATPWLAALALRFSDHSAWQGAVVLVAGVLWFSTGWAALMLAVAVAIPSAVLARAAGPSSRWFGLGGPAVVDQPFRTLDDEPTYGPLTDRRTGATMLTITAPAPALWRVQTLDYLDGRWLVPGGDLPELPQPAATREDVRVHVVGLRENLVVAPGRIDRVTAGGRATPTEGEGMVLAPTPATGSTYRVEAATLHATAGQLSGDRTPLSAGARAYTRVAPATEPGKQLRQLSWLLGPLLALLPATRQPAVDPRVVALARGLARGARTEWEIVTRVEGYLVDSGRFRYTTRVAEPGPQPLADFLLRTHAGYCQQFAGGAALLLRLAGVPARVAVGFATGMLVGARRYAVRDVDAHEWIEVYFAGYGWVPFNPTPAADPAVIASGIDPLSPSQPPATAREELARGGLWVDAAVIALSAAAASAVACRSRRRSRASTDWLWRVTRHVGEEIGPSTTLGEVRELLAARIGPRTAAIVSEVERQRFAGDTPAMCACSRIDVARALLGDLGPVRSALLWVRGPRRLDAGQAPGQGETGHPIR